jgi:transmembrane sensor
MNDETMLPDDDRDLRLARRLGERLAEGRLPEPPAVSSDEEEAALFRALLNFRAETAEEVAPEVSERVWAKLMRQIEPGLGRARERRPLRLVRPAFPAMRLVRPWAAVAATVLVLVAVGWWLARPSGPTPVAVAEAETARFVAGDGSTVTLRPHSRLYAVRVDETEMRYRLEGEAFFDVTPNPARTFAVEAGGGLVSVLGTRFDVSTWGLATTVYLEAGRVRFERPATGEAVVLEPGQRSVLTPRGALLAPEPAPPDEYLDWLRGEMTFTQRPLSRILAELAHHYGLAFDVPPSVEHETLTGRILLGPPEQTLRDLGVVMGGRFEKTGEHRYRFVPDSSD